MKLVLASNNENKLKEVKAVLEKFDFEVISQKQAGISVEVDETGTTFEENAYLKAAEIFKLLHIPVISDDSGLEVDYLDGKPGIYSARYAEVGKRKDKVLSELEGVPEEKRTARFVCVICYIDSNGEVHYFRGTVEGRIGFEKRGENGFGYDSIFYVGDKSFAEISPDEKNKISHRAKALNLLEEYLEDGV